MNKELAKELRSTIIAGNWKMNMLTSEVQTYADGLLPLITDFGKWCGVVVCTPFVSLGTAMTAFSDTGVSVGAQNISQHESGAYTGEVSGAQLRDLGVGYAIVGHSERREMFGESDEIVNQKVIATLKYMRPILCVGETLEQREAGITNAHIASQVKAALSGVSAEQCKDVVVAYEPIWAIGTGKTASPEDAQAVCAEIRGVLQSLYGEDVADVISILYGGSMNEKNAFELLSQPDIDGGLVGGASLKPDTFAEIINAANQ